MRRRSGGFTLIEILLAVVIVGVLATLALGNYARIRQTALDREAVGYLQMLRHAALAYYEEWQAYPTLRSQVPAVQTPLSGHWTYDFRDTNTAQWTTPRATRGSRTWVIDENGNIS